MAVIGEESISSYRLFLPPHEIDMGIRLLLSTIRDMPNPQAVFLVYKAFLEHIHPFPDANGRIVRICMSLILKHYGFSAYFTTEHKILTLEKYCSIIDATDRIYDAQ
jgi:Fic family protein